MRSTRTSSTSVRSPVPEHTPRTPSRASTVDLMRLSRSGSMRPRWSGAKKKSTSTWTGQPTGSTHPVKACDDVALLEAAVDVRGVTAVVPQPREMRAQDGVQLVLEPVQVTEKHPVVEEPRNEASRNHQTRDPVVSRRSLLNDLVPARSRCASTPPIVGSRPASAPGSPPDASPVLRTRQPPLV